MGLETGRVADGPQPCRLLVAHCPYIDIVAVTNCVGGPATGHRHGAALVFLSTAPSLAFIPHALPLSVPPSPTLSLNSHVTSFCMGLLACRLSLFLFHESAFVQ